MVREKKLLYSVCMDENIFFVSESSVGMLTMVNTTECICPGLSVVSFRCSITGGGTTIWQGSAIEPCVNNIILNHLDFDGRGRPRGECTERGIVAYGIDSFQNTYVSQLDVWISNELQGKTIICAYDNGTAEVAVGSTVLITNTGNLCHFSK